MHKDHKEETSASLEENCNGLVFEREKATMKLPSAILWMRCSTSLSGGGLVESE